MPVLTRLQQNELFTHIRDAGLEPTDFRWVAEDTGYPRGNTETLTHQPTSSHISVSHTGDKYWAVAWPQPQGISESSYFNPEWRAIARFAQLWVAAVKQNHAAPDLWAEVAKTNALQDAAGHPDPNGKPFSESELKQLDSGLDDIELYITSTQPLDPTGTQEVKRRFAYLRAAAKRAATKVDWLNIFVGQLVQMVQSGLFDPKFYQPLMQHAASALNAVFQFGVKLLG